MKQSECDKQCRVIIWLMIFITFIWIFVWLVIGRMMWLSEKRNPSEEHKQVMSRLESVERACSDIWMQLQN